MSIRDSEGSRYISFVEGVDDTTVVGSKELVGTLSKGDNTDLVDDSLLKKRNGSFPVNTAAWSTRRIRGGIEYKNSNGTVEQLLYGESSTTTGTSGILGKINGTSTPTTITSGLKDDIKPSLFQFRSLIFLLNGTNNLIYNGTTTRQIGIDGPVSAPSLSTTISGSLNTSAAYIYGYSYYNTVTGAESNLSPISDSFTTGSDSSGSGFTINVVAGTSTTADKIRIYRSVSGGDVLFFVDEISITSTSYSDTIADVDLGTEAELDNSRLPEVAKFGIVNDNRIFAGGFPSNPNRTHYSKIGITGPMPESFQALDFIDCNINDGDKILGYGVAGTSTIVLKERSVGRLTRIDSATGGLERQGSPKYIYEEISSQVTGISHHLMVSLDNICIWLGRDDVYGTDGVNIFRFGKRRRRTIIGLDFSQAHKWSCINKTKTQQILFAVTQEGQTEPNYQLVGHYRNFPKIAWTNYNYGLPITTYPGLNVGCFFEVTIDRQKEVYFGSAAAEGTVFQMDVGASDNSLAIYWDVRLPWDDGQNPAAQKLFHSYYLFALGGTSSTNNTLVFTWEENYNEDTIIKTATSNVSNSTVAWNGTTWNGSTWDSGKFTQVKFFPHRRAYSGRLGWNNLFADKPIAIKAVSGIKQFYPIHR